MAGATGLVGREILDGLLADSDYAAVHTVARRPLGISHPKLIEHVVDFAALPALPAVGEVFIALGTTIKVAGSQAAFRAVDYDAVLAVARAGRASGAKALGVVSAMGSDPHSSLFYSRVKGEMEAAIGELGYVTLVIARPSFLSGDRAALQQPLRGGEKLAMQITQALGPLIPANYRAIDVAKVARALRAKVKAGALARQVLLSGELQKA